MFNLGTVFLYAEWIYGFRLAWGAAPKPLMMGTPLLILGICYLLLGAKRGHAKIVAKYKGCPRHELFKRKVWSWIYIVLSVAGLFSPLLRSL